MSTQSNTFFVYSTFLFLIIIIFLVLLWFLADEVRETDVCLSCSLQW